MARAVILEHTLPDGSWHFDWMVEDATLGTDRCLRVWRTSVRPDLALEFAGERIGDHRRAYLSYEGPITGGRGSVRRVGGGAATGWVVGAGGATGLIAWDDGPNLRYHGCIGAGGVWLFAALRELGVDGGGRL